MRKTPYKRFVNNEITYYEYLNLLYQSKGYENCAEYQRARRYKLELCKPMDENKSCPSYLGVVVAERVLSKIFNDVRRMPSKNKGFDFVCHKGHKIDVKSACLRNNHYWTFWINKNIIADYFLLLAFDNRSDLNPKGVWLMPGNVLNMKYCFGITNTEKGRAKYKRYEQTDKTERVISCCKEIKELVN